MHIRDTYSNAGEMITIQKTKDNVIYSEELFNFENFLLLHESSQQAFMNLSKTKDAVNKDDLLDETKRLLQEHIMKQMKIKSS